MYAVLVHCECKTFPFPFIVRIFFSLLVFIRMLMCLELFNLCQFIVFFSAIIAESFEQQRMKKTKTKKNHRFVFHHSAIFHLNKTLPFSSTNNLHTTDLITLYIVWEVIANFRQRFICYGINWTVETTHPSILNSEYLSEFEFGIISSSSSLQQTKRKKKNPNIFNQSENI